MLVRQERIFFRNIPLSNWVEQEMPLEEGVDTDKWPQTMSVFAERGAASARRPKHSFASCCGSEAFACVWQ